MIADVILVTEKTKFPQYVPNNAFFLPVLSVQVVLKVFISLKFNEIPQKTQPHSERTKLKECKKTCFDFHCFRGRLPVDLIGANNSEKKRQFSLFVSRRKKKVERCLSR